jgi:hypothetical protein
VKSSLERIAPLCREPDEGNARRGAAWAWHEHGMLVLRPEWLNGWAQRQEAENMGNKLWGKRNEHKS